MAGRPRDRDLERRLLAAAWALMTREGYAAVTFAKVATEAGAHRTDVYRRWSSTVHLATDAVSAHQPPIAAVDTGTLYGDLRAVLGDIDAAWSSASADAILGWLADLQQHPEVEAAYRAVARRRSRPLHDAVARAAARGEIAQMPSDFALIGHLLEGPVMHRHVFYRLPFTPEDLDVVAAAVHHRLTGRVGEPV